MRKIHKRKNNKAIIISLFLLTFIMITGYSLFNTNLSINTKGNLIKQAKIKQFNYNSSDDFHNEIYKNNIVNVSFIKSTNIPNNAIKSWDISENNNKSVIAYILTNPSDSTKYDLFISSKNGIQANKDSSYLFYNFPNLKAIKFNKNYNTSNTLYMNDMFANCYNLKNIDLENLITDNATDMYEMFFKCRKLEKINLSNFNTSNVTNMGRMFSMAENPNDISNSNLQIIDVSNFNTSNVESMFDMFAYNDNLKQIIGLTNFDTSNVTSTQGMFYYDSALTEIDLSSFDTSKTNAMWQMFGYATNLRTIYVSNKFTTKAFNQSDIIMFSRCNNLVGGNGTVFSNDHLTKEYARIDTPTEPGYFTLKEN